MRERSLVAGNRLLVSLVCIIYLFLWVTNSVFAADDDYIIATVGEEKIYFSEIQQAADELNRFLKENFETSKDWRLDYVRRHVARFVLTKRAEKEGLDKEKDVMFAMEQAKRNILSDKILSNRIAEIKITEDGLKQYYAENKIKYQIKERVKINYVKLKSRKEADRIIAGINKGKSFKKAAGKKIKKINEWVNSDGMMISGLENITSEALNKIVALGIGGTSEVIELAGEQVGRSTGESGRWYYVFHVTEREPAKDRPYEEVAKQVEFELNKKLKDQVIGKFIGETFLREKVQIYEGKVIEEMERELVGEPVSP